jgi:2-hydroxychromene-2-carboxylate isomerase
MQIIHWYFDFISPYAWLQNAQLERLSAQAQIRRQPVLFAGLLKHWGQKGPAEMATKRSFTYQHIAWYARQQGLSLKWPARHPFNPLPLLRLSALLGNTPEAVDRLFAYVWQEGHLPDEMQPWAALLSELGVKAEDLDRPDLKEEIRLTTDQALKKGVFGVPSAIVESVEPRAAVGSQRHADSPIFWGFDSTPMLQAWLDQDSFFVSSEYLGAGQVGDGIVRKS